MSNDESKDNNLKDLLNALLDREIRNPEPEADISTEPDTFGTAAGEQLDKALIDFADTAAAHSDDDQTDDSEDETK